MSLLLQTFLKPSPSPGFFFSTNKFRAKKATQCGLKSAPLLHSISTRCHVQSRWPVLVVNYTVKFQSRHIITCHTMIPIACQRLITSAHHNAAIWLFQPQLSGHALSLCVSYDLSLGWQHLSFNRTHMFNTKKASMLSSVYLSFESQTLHRLDLPPTNHF